MSQLLEKKPPASEVAAKSITDSPQFKAWFAGSKVVNSKGQPLRMFHGTASDFDEFSLKLVGRNFGDEAGFYFTNNTNHDVAHYSDGTRRVWEDTTSAGGYANNDAETQRGNRTGARIMPVFLSVQNPMVVEGDTDGEGVLSLGETPVRGFGTLLQRALKQGHDGVILRDLGHHINGEPETVVAVPSPNQIKSAIGNNGNFNPDKTSITAAAPSPAAFTPARDIRRGDMIVGKPTFMVRNVYREGDEIVVFGGPGVVRRFDLNDEVQVRRKKVAAAVVKAADAPLSFPTFDEFVKRWGGIVGGLTSRASADELGDKLYPTWKKRYEDWVDFHRNAGNPRVIYRAIRVPNAFDINTDKLGLSWSWDDDYAIVYDHSGTGKKYVVRAAAYFDDIDWMETIHLNLEYDGNGNPEKEIRLKPKAQIEVTGIRPGNMPTFETFHLQHVTAAAATQVLYHVTFLNRLSDIAEEGLVPGSRRSIGGPALDGHANGKVFLTKADGVSFWLSRAEMFAYNDSDNPVEEGYIPVVLRVQAQTHGLTPDGPGTDDAAAEAFYMANRIDPNKIEFWSGNAWSRLAGTTIIPDEYTSIYQGIGSEIDPEGGLDSNSPLNHPKLAAVAEAPAADITETPAFKAWFNGSKVVDDHGRPLRVFHGTNADFDTFDPEKGARSSEQTMDNIPGVSWFAANPEAGTYFGGWRDGAQVMPVYLSIKNPRVADLANMPEVRGEYFNIGKTRVYDIRYIKGREIQQAKDDGNDGVIFLNGYDGTPASGTILAVFSANQIKSAIGNNGEFDPTSTSITAAQHSTVVDDTKFTIEPITAEESSFEGTHAPGVRIEAHLDHQIVGAIEIYFENNNAYVRGITVTKHYQRQGLGQALYDQAIAYAKKEGYNNFYSDRANAMSPPAHKAWGRMRDRYDVEFEEGEGGHDSTGRKKINLRANKTAGLGDFFATAVTRTLPLDLKKFEFFNDRDRSKVKELTKALQNGEELDPILVAEMPGKRYKVLDGNHRLDAQAKAGKTEVEAYVVDMKELKKVLKLYFGGQMPMEASELDEYIRIMDDDFEPYSKRAALKTITREQATQLLRSADEKGKNKGSDSLDDFSYLRPGPYVLVDMPLADLDYISQTPDREEFYAAVPGKFPPVYALFGPRSLKNHLEDGDPLKAHVTNGNHRCMAAELRGDQTIPTIMNAAQHEFFEQAKREHGQSKTASSATFPDFETFYKKGGGFKQFKVNFRQDRFMRWFETNTPDADKETFTGLNLYQREYFLAEKFREFVKQKTRERYDKWVAFWDKQTFPITVYRAVNTPSEDAINTEHAGIHWTFTEDKAFAARGRRKGGTDYVLRGIVRDAAQVNWEETLWQNCHDGEDEDEIQVNPGTEVLITGIRESNGEWRDFGHHVVTATQEPKTAEMVSSGNVPPGYFGEPQTQHDKRRNKSLASRIRAVLSDAKVDAKAGERWSQNCSAYAQEAIDRIEAGGQIWGYSKEENPTATVADESGHDFAIIGDYIVDPWAMDYLGTPGMIPLANRAKIEELYGDPNTWSRYDFAQDRRDEAGEGLPVALHKQAKRIGPVYHGAAKWHDTIRNDQYRVGRFFSSSPDVAKKYGPKVFKACITINKPFRVDAKGEGYQDIRTPKAMRPTSYGDTVDADNIAEFAWKNGHDGAIIKNVFEGNGVSVTADDYIVFNPSQIEVVAEADVRRSAWGGAWFHEVGEWRDVKPGGVPDDDYEELEWDESGKTASTGTVYYHGDTQGGSLFAGTTKLPDIPGFYLTPSLRHAESFTKQFATKPGGAITAYELVPSSKVTTYDDLKKAGVFKRNPHQLVSPHSYDYMSKSYRDDQGNKQSPPNPEGYYQFIADEARKLGYDAIARHRQGEAPELIVLNKDILREVPMPKTAAIETSEKVKTETVDLSGLPGKEAAIETSIEDDKMEPVDLGKMASADDAAAARNEIMAKFPENPDNSKERVLMAQGEPAAYFEVDVRGERLRLRTIRSSAPRQGIGSLVLKRILAVADKFQVPVELTASPYGDEDNRIDGDTLRNWYRRFGFESENGFDSSLGYMLRSPKTQKQSRLLSPKPLVPAV